MVLSLPTRPRESNRPKFLMSSTGLMLLKPVLIPVRAKAKRAHQGWRYLEEKDAPRDLATGEVDARSQMPPRMLNELSKLGLI